MNSQFDLYIITQPYSEVYCRYFRCLVFGNSLSFPTNRLGFMLNLLELYIRNADIHNHHTRHIDDIHLPNVHFDITRRSFVYKSPLEWLQLSDKLKNAKSQSAFKFNIRKRLLYSY